MATARQVVFMSEEEYLESEKKSELKREYINGQVYAMAGASSNHNLLCGNVHTAFNVHLKGNPCRPYMSDMKVKIGSQYYYPDVLVNCSKLLGDSYYTDSPTIIVEVLSKSTRRNDETKKRMAYMQIATLEEYVLIEQDIGKIAIMRRSGGWITESYYLGDDVSFTSIGLTVAVEDIYDGVQNSDMTDWLEQKATE
ncbi:MAG: Uma2 family endonuclease [Moraxellaceae bacterium]|nr:Uma2 family endonuclease [Moraxellaceae bacterium]